MFMTFLDTFTENVRNFPDRVALEFIDAPLQRLTYAELDELAARTAGYLQGLGLRPGDRLALQLSKCLEFILLHLGALRLGAVSLPLNPAYPPDEVEYFLSDSGATLFFALESAKERLESILPRLSEIKGSVFLEPGIAGSFLSQIRSASSLPDAAERDPNETAVIIYTSGTTGRPKGAEITHGNLAANLDALHAAWGWQPDDILLHVLPVFHVHGLFVGLHGALHAGATTLLVREFDARKTLQTLVERRCTVFMAVPTIHQRLVEVQDAGGFDLSHMRLITSGSDRLPDKLFAEFERTFGYRLLERYGMTETGMNCSNPLHGERRMGSVGLPLPGVEARIVDPETVELLADGQVGEMQVRGAHVFKGYWRQPGKTAEAFTSDGWFRTGDLGFQESDGYFTLCGRSKDLIISGGMNIYPPEVERVLAEHPAVDASAVVGCPDVEWGERVTAVVVLKQDQAASAEELIGFCRQRLAPYKCPKRIVFQAGLPRNAMGKAQKAELRKAVCSDDQ
jgi:malonyl-CoA/methylmalonyl-CoA synthetase